LFVNNRLGEQTVSADSGKNNGKPHLAVVGATDGQPPAKPGRKPRRSAKDQAAETQQASPPGGGDPPWSWSKFFDGLTFSKAVYLCLAFFGLVAIFWDISHDTQPNKAKIQEKFYELQLEQQKTKQTEVLAPSRQVVYGGDSPVAVAPSTASAYTPPKPSHECIRMNDFTAGSFLLAKGHCISVPKSEYPFGLATESPIVSIDGADFIISDEQSSQCDSADITDRCVVWLQSHKKLGRGDSRFGIPRYWFVIESKGDINIKTN
jgi:hypothetical protein